MCPNWNKRGKNLGKGCIFLPSEFLPVRFWMLNVLRMMSCLNFSWSFCLHIYLHIGFWLAFSFLNLLNHLSCIYIDSGTLRLWIWKKNLTHTHTHTHTHVGFYGLRGLAIGVMVFILYKLFVLLPYTYPTPKLSPHRRRCISTFPPKNAHCMIYKHFKLWGHWKCPHKSPSPCNTDVIPMSLYKFVSS